MNIFVTGASRGIGKKIAQVLSAENQVFVCARSNTDFENFVRLDLSTPDGIKAAGKYIEENNIDVLINNAGEYLYSPIEEMNYSDIERIIKLDLEAPYYLISKAIPYMKKNRFGRIINIGSISGVMGEANASLYSAAKSALIGMTKALALEVAEYNITVNTINPGWVDTDMGNSSAEESDFTKDEIISCIPQKRFVAPDEIAGMVNYLISDIAKGVTGQSINLCAGLSVGC